MSSGTNSGTLRWNDPIFQGYNGTDWVKLSSVGASTQWITTGSDIYFDAGLVGIGTSSPSELLHIYNASNHVKQILETDKVDGIASLIFRNDAIEWIFGVSGDDWLGISDDTAGTVPVIILPNTPTFTLFLNDSGYVGIGTASPQNELNVIGDINSTGQYFGDGSQLTGIQALNVTTISDEASYNISTVGASYNDYGNISTSENDVILIVKWNGNFTCTGDCVNENAFVRITGINTGEVWDSELLGDFGAEASYQNIDSTNDLSFDTLYNVDLRGSKGSGTSTIFVNNFTIDITRIT